MGSLVLLVLIFIISSGNTAPKWTPDWAPEVKEATLKFFDKFNFAEKGGLAKLQPKQIPNFYIADIAPVAEARKLFLDTFADHEVGKHADLAPVNTDVQPPQIANSYLADTDEVREAREMHENAINMVESGGLAQLQQEQIPNFYIADIPLVTEEKARFLAVFADHELGKHADLAPVNTDVQAAPIANTYIADTDEVVAAKEMHEDAVNVAKTGGLAQLQAEQIPSFYIADVPEVAEEKDKFLAVFADHELGKHADLAPVNTAVQSPQIANFYLADIPVVAEAKEKFSKVFADHELGKHADLAPVNTDVQAPQIANTYIADTAEVAAAKKLHQDAVNMVEAGELAQPVPFNAAIEPAPKIDVADEDSQTVVEPVDVKSSVPVAEAVPAVVHAVPIQYIQVPVQYHQPIYYHTVPILAPTTTQHVSNAVDQGVEVV